MIWQVWKDIKTGESLTCPAGPEGDRARELIPNGTLLHTFDAKTHFDVKATFHEIMGYEPFTTEDPFYFLPIEEPEG